MAWVALGVCVTARVPVSFASAWSILLPSSDIGCALLLVAFLAWGGLSIHARYLSALAAGSVITRVYLIADSICERYLGRPFDLFTDLKLVPELVRMVHTLGGMLGISAIVIALSVGVWGFWYVARWLWWIACLSLSDGTARRTLLSAVVVLIALQLAISRAGVRFFAPPVVPIILGQLGDLLHAQVLDDGRLSMRRDALLRRLAATERTLKEVGSRQPPSRADVHIFLIEAYGHTVFTSPAYFERMLPALGEVERALRSSGFYVCTDVLTAPTFGGGSWYTHATLETGVHVSDQFDYDTLLAQTRVPTLARMFTDAGYHTVSVKPGTTRPSPQTRFYGFDVEYTAWNLGYQGPRYAWAPMPDQYVLAALNKREPARDGHRRFIEYVLVSSHYPFAPLPPLLSDWSRLGNGSIFKHLDAQLTPPSSAGMSDVASAYVAGVAYDLRVVVDYLTRFVDQPALILVMGDHQPTAGIAGSSPSWSVPLHVISKNPELLRSWYAAGCTSGLVRNKPQPHRGVETLITQLVADFGLSPHEGP